MMAYNYTEADGEQPITDLERLKNRLDAMGARLVAVERGSGLATTEELAKAINDSLDRIEAGDFDEWSAGAPTVGRA